MGLISTFKQSRSARGIEAQLRRIADALEFIAVQQYGGYRFDAPGGPVVGTAGEEREEAAVGYVDEEADAMRELELAYRRSKGLRPREEVEDE